MKPKIDKRSIAGVLPNSTIFSRCFKINCANGIRTGQTELHALHKEQAYGNSLNIIKNAAESIEGDAGENGQQGEIIVRTTAPASVEVVDNGPGISKETEAKLFSPFFSTKPNGQGIGLVFIREVLSRHGCTFSLRTYNDGLTRFRILFN